MVQTMKETANVLEYKIGNNANIANFVCLWNTRIRDGMKPFSDELTFQNLKIDLMRVNENDSFH